MKSMSYYWWADGLGGNKGHGEGHVHEFVKRGRCRRDLGTGRLDVGLKLSWEGP